MKFLNGYELSIVESDISTPDNIIFELDLCLYNRPVLCIKMDSEFMLTLSELIESVYVDSIPFTIQFPLQSTTEIYKMCITLNINNQGYYTIEISKINIYQQRKVYTFNISFEEADSLIQELWEVSGMYMENWAYTNNYDLKNDNV